jgi:hypothetical protein
LNGKPLLLGTFEASTQVLQDEQRQTYTPLAALVKSAFFATAG